MRVLMLSRDKNILLSGTDAYQRHSAYKAMVERLDVLVFGKWFLKREGVGFGAYDLVVAQDPFETGLLGVVAAKVLGAYLQIQVHTDFSSPLLKSESILYMLRSKIARFVLSQADCVRVVSRRIEKALLDQGLVPQEKIRRIPIVSPASSNKGSLGMHRFPFSHTLLMVSRLSREKNIFLALHAVARFLKSYPKAGLVLVGDGPLRVALEVECVKLGIEKSVVFAGWSNDVESYYRAADLFLLTSDYEGYSVALVDAARYRCPIVTTDVGLVGDVLGGSEAAIVPPRDIEALVRAIAETIENRILSESRVESAFRCVNELPSWESYLEEYKQSWLTCGTR